ncbi:MAG: bifunctional glutamate N-acetyltransferase/amino-acid acetyltransferase ArgJ [Defluviitaleaceae bacterium]|nr:bifunctional glutamate N-acetyltransferase/amino-acid acetyltransferase ArgJ [Defluviitaleaceae bacterium]
MDIEFIPGGVTAAQGFTASGVHCGIRKNRSKLDLALILADRNCSAAATLTTNKVKAAPIWLTIEHLKNGQARGIIANSGNANACAPGGMEAAKKTVATVAAETGLSPEDFIVNSTGVIGQPLPVDAITTAIPDLVKSLSPDGNTAADAIMTTDTFPKKAAVRFTLGGKTVTLGGIAKGSGMIHPNMATMFAFITTDCAIDSALLQAALSASVNRTYNCISVDGDTSTNDMTAILASGAAENPMITEKNADFDIFVKALNAVNLKLAKDIARDGEGATKLITCNVMGASSYNNAITLAKSVISSSLVKAAMFGADANWGREMCAMGYSGAEFDPSNVDIAFSSLAGQIPVCQHSKGLPFDEDLAKEILNQKEVVIQITLYEGDYKATAYGCDLTYDYVKINGDYRT